MECHRCAAANLADARFCEDCGAPLDLACTTCGTVATPGKRFCRACGAALAEQTVPDVPEQAVASRATYGSERKQVTILFCDLVNSTGLAERLGDEGAHSLVNRFFDLGQGEVQRYGGMVSQFMGDGFMALFGAPIAYEDHARRAALAALGIQRRFEEQRAALAEQFGAEVAVRIGLNTGLVIVGRIGDELQTDYTAIGDTANVAARLEQGADPGTIVASEATARLVAGYVRVEPFGDVQVRGRHEPVTAYRVLGVGPRRSPLEGIAPRMLGEFVGRDRQLAELQELFQEVTAGHGQAVGIGAEPGMGKSRLVYEFRRSLGGHPVTYLEGRCLSYGMAIPYLPILDILRSNCAVAQTDDPDAVAEKVRFALQEVQIDPDESAPYLLHLLGIREGPGLDRLALLSPEAIKARTFETLQRMARQGSHRRPIVLVVEDLHWMDATSEEYLASVVESMAGCPIMLICTYRPGYAPPWMNLSYSTQIALHRLSSHDSLSIIRAVLRTDHVAEPLAAVILDKAEGNPFFLEELAKAVAEHDDFRAELAVPDTVQGVLAARIDRLPDESRRVLQTASVLGREFHLRLLGAIWHGQGPLEPHLLELKRLEFLYEQTSAGEPVYVFKHALTQDVAYGSLLVSRRQTLHAAAGRALEELYADRLEDVYDDLAHHYSKADEAAKAVEYLCHSAAKAARSYASADAVKALEEALVHVERLPAADQDRLILDITTRLAHSYYFLGRVPDTLQLLLAQRERLERLGDPVMAGPYFFWLAHTYSYLGDYDRAASEAHRAIAEAERCGDTVTLGKAHYVLARIGFWVGPYTSGVEHGRQAVALLEDHREWLWLGQSHWAVGINHLFMGSFEAALESERYAHAIGDAIGDARLQTYSDWCTGWIQATSGEWEAGLEACQRSLARSRDAFNTACALGWSGFAHLQGGDPASAIPLLEQSIEHWTRIGYRGILGWFNAWLSDALRQHGETERARQVALEAVEIGRAVKNPYAPARAQRVLGRIALSEGALADAERYLTEAHDAFAAARSRFELGETLLALAELARAQGQPAATAAHLAQAREIFTAIGSPRYVELTDRLATPDLSVQREKV